MSLCHLALRKQPLELASQLRILVRQPRLSLIRQALLTRFLVGRPCQPFQSHFQRSLYVPRKQIESAGCGSSVSGDFPKCKARTIFIAAINSIAIASSSIAENSEEKA
jgi:hypothetical protein